MTDKTVSHVWIAAVVLILCLFIGFVAVGSSNLNEDEVKKIVFDEFEWCKLNIPTASEIASEIVIEVPEWDAPVIPEFESDDKVNDLWEDRYSGIIATLKGNATEDATLEIIDFEGETDFKFCDEEEACEDLKEFLELNILNFKEVEDVNEKDVEVTVLELGLEDKEDKVAQVVFELEVTYTLTEGPSNDEYEKTVFATADVVYDEGDFTDEKVELAFALE